ncbi:MAG: hypothetical protein NZ824_07835 [Candidatus Thioglobus sp.]|nr:hypothetical protein [Candidatus Thioglobus sp.]
MCEDDEKDETVENKDTKQTNNKETMCEDDENEKDETVENKDTKQTNDKETICEDENDFGKDDTFEISCPPSDLLGQYVAVVYDETPYPGLVIDTGDTDVYVRCMHKVGKDTRNGSFFWPQALVDECWYSLDNVLTVIPEPVKNGRHYAIDENIWGKIIEYLNDNKKG